MALDLRDLQRRIDTLQMEHQRMIAAIRKPDDEEIRMAKSANDHIDAEAAKKRHMDGLRADPEIPADLKESELFWRRFLEATERGANGGDSYRFRNPSDMPDREREFLEKIEADREAGVYSVLLSLLMTAGAGLQARVHGRFFAAHPDRRGLGAFAFAPGERADMIQCIRSELMQAIEAYCGVTP